MNSNPTSPSPEESASAANSSTNLPAPEIRSDSVIHVPPDLIPPEDPTPPGYDIQYLPVDQHETLRAAQNIPPDFRVPWSWTDIVLFAIFYFGITVVVGVILLGIDAGITHRNLQVLAADKPVSAIVGIVAQAIGSALSLLYLWALIRKRRGGPFWQAIGWRPAESKSPRIVCALGRLFWRESDWQQSLSLATSFFRRNKTCRWKKCFKRAAR